MFFGKKFATAIAGLALSVSASAAPLVVNFDDLQGRGTVADGYGGINWGGTWSYFDETFWPYIPHSGSQRVSGFSHLQSHAMKFASDVTFLGAYFAGFSNVFGSPNFDPVDVQFELYLDGALQFTSSKLTPSVHPRFLESGYTGAVDEVRVLSARSGYFVMDDVTYDLIAPQQVPEPCSLMLFGAAGLGLLAARRRAARQA